MQLAEDQILTNAEEMRSHLHEECSRLAVMVEVTDKLTHAYQNLSSKNISPSNISTNSLKS